MSKTLFFGFYRGFPRVVGFALLGLAVVAVIDYRTGSLVPESNAAVVSTVGLPAASFADGEWTSTPRECDVLAGISTDCVFMD